MKFLAITFSTFVLFTASAADWLQFRGPHGNGISDETGLSAKLETENIAWKCALPGRGLSSPLIIGERVFVTCSSGPKQDRLHVICFDAKDGKKIWERQFWATGQTACHDKSSVAAPTPASDGQRIYAIFSSNDMVCLDRDGNLIWFRGLTRDYPDASNGLGMSSSLLIADGVVVTMLENEGDSFTVGLDATTGLNRWKMSRPKKANWTSPIRLPARDGKSLVALQSGEGITAIEPATGKVVWQSPGAASRIPSLTLGGDMLYMPTTGVIALKLDAENQPPKELWQSSQLTPATASGVALGEKLFLVNNAGVLTCASASDGNRIWQLRLKGPFSGSPVASGNILYFVNEKGLLQTVDTAKPEGEIVSNLDLKETVLSTPAIANGALYIRGNNTLWKLKGS